LKGFLYLSKQNIRLRTEEIFGMMWVTFLHFLALSHFFNIFLAIQYSLLLSFRNI